MGRYFIIFVLGLLSLSELSAKPDAFKGPDFIIFGTVKGGSTSLWHYLRAHPQLRVGSPKEIHYFDLHYNRGQDWYLSCFQNRSIHPDTLYFEATPGYLSRPNVPERMAKDFPSMKLILVLRNPVDRLFSHYRLFMGRRLSKGKEAVPLSAMLRRSLQRMQHAQKEPQTSDFHVMVRHGMYLHLLKRWLKHFPKEQIHIFLSEQLFENPSESLTQIYDFLQVPPHLLQSYTPHNVTKKDGLTFPPALREQIADFYRPLNEELETFLREEMGLDIELNWD